MDSTPQTDETTKMKAWIDAQSYETLLRKWRQAPSGDRHFQGAMGEYYSAALARKRAEERDGGVGASKRIGWGT